MIVNKDIAEEMLEACKAAQKALSIHGPCSNHSCSRCELAWNLIAAVLRKFDRGERSGGYGTNND